MTQQPKQRAPQPPKPYQIPPGSKCSKCGKPTARLTLPGHGTWEVCIPCDHRVKVSVPAPA